MPLLQLCVLKDFFHQLEDIQLLVQLELFRSCQTVE